MAFVRCTWVDGVRVGSCIGFIYWKEELGVAVGVGANGGLRERYEAEMCQDEGGWFTLKELTYCMFVIQRKHRGERPSTIIRNLLIWIIIIF